MATQRDPRQDAAAQFALAQRYESGQGVAPDPAAAFACYLRAARLGHARAQFELGRKHASGQGARRDLLAAYAWLLQAEHAGEAEAGPTLHQIAARMSHAQLAHVAQLRAEVR
ncbi:tetratricopeptide repeat protein [Massilia sp. CF038]|uniref:tetratricopeptide repeat protein n=1 Tax=Massilia sp. CF038 TaxID=1881045 RepID=UPI0009116BB2|nr:SEL1-like repeat protein [Massilia sp. CF038]SHH54896.1 hypothetical protein SAMN05428948_4405 [Massilia sp. CF038]